MGKQTAKLLVALLVSVTGLTACGKKEEGATVVGRGAVATSAINTWAQASGIVLNGNVTATSGEQSIFQDALSGFTEGKYAPEVLGYVSATYAGGTGVAVGGRVELQSGVLNTNSGFQSNVRSDGKVLVAVYDEYTGRVDASGEQVGPLFRAFTSASGYVQGNRAYVRLQDEYGSIEMEGTFGGSSFYGTFVYDNTRRWDGSGQGAAGKLGNFHVPTCQFFRCQ